MSKTQQDWFAVLCAFALCSIIFYCQFFSDKVVKEGNIATKIVMVKTEAEKAEEDYDAWLKFQFDNKTGICNGTTTFLKRQLKYPSTFTYQGTHFTALKDHPQAKKTFNELARISNMRLATDKDFLVAIDYTGRNGLGYTEHLTGTFICYWNSNNKGADKLLISNH